MAQTILHLQRHALRSYLTMAGMLGIAFLLALAVSAGPDSIKGALRDTAPASVKAEASPIPTIPPTPVPMVDQPVSAELPYVPNELLVQLKGSAALEHVQKIVQPLCPLLAVEPLISAAPLRAFAAARGFANVYRFRFAGNCNALRMRALLEERAAPYLSDVQPNLLYEADTTPPDPLFPEQWGLQNTGQTGGKPDADIDAPEGWDIEDGSSNLVTVAILDYGIDPTHEDLRAQLWTNGDVPGDADGDGNPDDDGNGFIDDEHGYDFAAGDGVPEDTDGHGTHIAGIIGAAANNGFGISGVNPHARLMAVKVCTVQCEESDIINGVLYAVANGAKVISMSFGTYNQYGEQSLLAGILSIANAEGVVLVASAGNHGVDLTRYPAGYAEVLGIGATDERDDRAWFTGGGSTNYGKNNVDVVAPGKDVLSTFPAYLPCDTCEHVGYNEMSGTSMATPMVSGLAALILAKNPTLPPDAVRAIIINSADLLFQYGWGDSRETGYGRINAHAALNQMPATYSRARITAPMRDYCGYRELPTVLYTAPTLRHTYCQQRYSAHQQIEIYGEAVASHFTRYTLSWAPGRLADGAYENPAWRTDGITLPYDGTQPRSHALLGMLDLRSVSLPPDTSAISIRLKVEDAELRPSKDGVYISLFEDTPPSLCSADIGDFPFPMHGHLRVLGAHPHAGTFTQPVSGDFNGDGIHDIALTELPDPVSGRTQATLHIIFGRTAFAHRELIELARDQTDVTIELPEGLLATGDFTHLTGFSDKASGDINGDGYDDLLFTIQRSTTVDLSQSNITIGVLYGAARMPARITSTAALSAIFELSAYPYVHHSITTADINGDRYADLIAGHYHTNPENNPQYPTGGVVHIIYGRASFPPPDSESLISPDVTILGDAQDNLGSVIASGDINRDGRADLVLLTNRGLPYTVPYFTVGVTGSYSALDNPRELYVVYGRGYPSGTVLDFPTAVPDITVLGAYDSRVDVSYTTTGDFNSDGFTDIVFSEATPDLDHPTYADAYTISLLAGNAYAPGTIIDLRSEPPDVRIFHILPNLIQEFPYGSSLSAGDFNDDGFDDLVMVAVGGGGPGGSDEPAGTLHLRHGDAPLSALTVSTPQHPETRIAIDLPYALPIHHTDITGDGSADLLYAEVDAGVNAGGLAGQTILLAGCHPACGGYGQPCCSPSADYPTIGERCRANSGLVCDADAPNGPGTCICPQFTQWNSETERCERLQFPPISD